MFGFLNKIFGSAQDRLVRKYRKVVKEVSLWEDRLKALSQDELKAKTQELKDRYQKGETLDDLLPEAYGLVKAVCHHLCGQEIHVSGYQQKWDMIPFDVQVLGAIAMHHGSIAEMMTGEGKTLTASMPLFLNALADESVHLVTVNDYLAKRDCEWVGSIFRWLGLSTGVLTNDTPLNERKEVYSCDVVYGTASEFGFDYLRDNSMAFRKDDQVQRGYFFAIVDEIDSILIDEARTPLIISGPVPESQQMYDDLKGPVANLVAKQKEHSNRIASEAKKILQDCGLLTDREQASTLEKHDRSSDIREALRKLWLVSKATPRNRVLKKAQEFADLRQGIDEWDVYYYGDQVKEEKSKALGQHYLLIDEKSSDFELTDKGTSAWEEFTGSHEGGSIFVMCDLGFEYSKIEQDPELDDDAKAKAKRKLREDDGRRKERAHNVRQLLRAHLLMEKDVDYIVQDERIVIIDENTGRPQPGRRFSDGLHQAIEAKESVAIQEETQTYATITLQNYFRMYKKLAGMTGTAMTEAGEFKEIYKLEVVEVPTHVPCIRDDGNDEIYMTEREKYSAILKLVSEEHSKGRPILIGTESVEASEKLGRIFSKNKLPHAVLNARHHESEAEIIAEAGRGGAITIATNMAGRGTDIKLESGVSEKGGLLVIGTTRQPARRIDRQLRGRCARQGDPGSSKFFCSFEDSLLRLFSSPRLNNLLQRFRPPEGEPISAGILNKSIETAQKRVEQRNYMIRKHTLEYDDVMNRQRQEIYSFRNSLLNSDSVREIAEEILLEMVSAQAEFYLGDHFDDESWNPEGFQRWLLETFPVTLTEGAFSDEEMGYDEILKQAQDLVLAALEQKMEDEKQKAELLHAHSQALNPPSPEEVAENAMRSVMLRQLDVLWKEHLLVMDHLRSEVNLRVVAQKDPLMEFKQDAFTLFCDLRDRMQSEIAKDLFRFQIAPFDPGFYEEIAKQLKLERDRSLVESHGANGNQEPAVSTKEEKESAKPVVQSEPRTGRNDPCPCGSGKKFKQCCMKQELEA